MSKTGEAYLDIIDRAFDAVGIIDIGCSLIALSDGERYPVDDFRLLCARIAEDFAQCHRCKGKPIARVEGKWYCGHCWSETFKAIKQGE